MVFSSLFNYSTTALLEAPFFKADRLASWEEPNVGDNDSVEEIL